MDKLSQQLKKAAAAAYNDIMAMAEVETENFIKDNFDNEGFSKSKWQPVKSKKSSKILTKSGKLADTLEVTASNGTIKIKSPLPYAKIHNNGGKAGRGGRSTIPKRQFIGESEELKKTFDKEISKILTKRLGNR